MEGVSHVTHYREIMPVHSEYWKTGRQRMTAEAVAAASGLIEGGAKEVVVIDGHGLGWPNLMEEAFPPGVRSLSQGDSMESFSGLMLVGFHAKCGTPMSFMSHTFVPYLRVAINGNLVTECHVWALRSGLPVIGVTGEEALGRELDGVLEGTPFLGVKTSLSRGEASPDQSSPQSSGEAIAKFARSCVETSATRKPAVLPSPFVVSVSMPSDLTRHAEGAGGLVRKSKCVLSAQGRSWRREGDAAVNAAMGAVLTPLGEIIGEMDFSSEEAVKSARKSDVEGARQYLKEWAEGNFASWED